MFEHLAVMLYRFHLYTFENPSGHDTIVDGYLSPGKNPANVFGLPYPFFTDSGTPMNPGIPPAGSDSSPRHLLLKTWITRPLFGCATLTHVIPMKKFPFFILITKFAMAKQLKTKLMNNEILYILPTGLRRA